MPQSQAKAKHHFVPRMLLGRFCNAGGRIEVWDCYEGRGFATNPKNIATIRGYYTGETSVDDEDDIIERLLSKLEGEAAPVLNRLIKSKKILTQQDWVKLCEFIAMLGHRTPFYREFHDQIGHKLFVDVLADEEHYERLQEIAIEKTGKPLGITQSELVEAAKRGGIELQHHQNEYLQGMIDITLKAYSILQGMTPHLVLSKDHLFVTSDNPVSRWNTAGNQPHAGWAHPNLQINFALSPNVTLLLNRSGQQGRVIEANGKLIAKLNAMTIATALRYIYSTGEHFAWEDSSGIVRWKRDHLQEVHGRHKKGQSVISETFSPPGGQFGQWTIRGT